MSTVNEPETWQQLIDDCAEIPRTSTSQPGIILPRAVPYWEIDEKCAAQVADLDEFI